MRLTRPSFPFPVSDLAHTATSSVDDDVSVPEEASKPTDLKHHLQVRSNVSGFGMDDPAYSDCT